MIPPEIDKGIAISVNELFCNTESIPAKIARQIYIVVIVYLIIELSIQIVKTGRIIYINKWEE